MPTVKRCEDLDDKDSGTKTGQVPTQVQTFPLGKMLIRGGPVGWAVG